MVLILIENVFSHRLEMRRAYTEKSVAILPVKVWNTQGLDKLRRIFLENLNHLSCREFLRKVTENMNVVRRATNRNGITLQVLKNS